MINGIFNIASFFLWGNILSSAGAGKDLGIAMEVAAQEEQIGDEDYHLAGCKDSLG